MSEKVAGFILPGTFGAANWGSDTLHYPAQIRAIGGNRVAFDVHLTTADWSSTDVTSAGLSDEVLGQLCVATKRAGCKFDLKPHLTTRDGSNQLFILPGAVWSKDLSVYANPWTGSYGSPDPSTVTAQWSRRLDQRHVGDRIVTPTFGHRDEIPHSGWDTYAVGPEPDWTRVTAVDGSRVRISNPVGITGSTRTSVVAILHDADARVFFHNWQNAIEHLLAVCERAWRQAGGIGPAVDGVNLCTELDHLMRYYGPEFEALIEHLGTDRPALEFWATVADGLRDAGSCPFYRHLTRIGISAYPSVGSPDGNDEPGLVRARWRDAVRSLPDWAAATGKRIAFAETGAASVPGAGHNPAAPVGRTPQQPAVDQDAFARGLLALLDEDWFDGFWWWVWDGPAGSANEIGYSPRGKEPTEGTFRAALLDRH